MATSVSDTFDRADGAIGANWADIWSGAGSFQVSSNQMVVGAQETLRAMAYTAAALDTADYSNYITVSSVSGSDFWVINLMLRCVGSGSTTVDAYQGQFFNNGTWTIHRMDNGVESVLTTGSTGAPVPGDRLGFSVSGTTFSIYKNGTSLGSTTDATYSAIGAPGIAIYQHGTTAVVFDNWDASLTATSSVAVAAASAEFSGQSIDHVLGTSWDEGALLLSGQDVTLANTLIYSVSVTEVVAALTGQSVDLIFTQSLGITEVVASLAGQTITFQTFQSGLGVDINTLLLDGQNVGLLDGDAIDYEGSSFPVFEVSTSGRRRWVEYIPVKYIVPTTNENVNTWNLSGGGLAVQTLASVSGLTQWVDYVPVVTVADPDSGANRFNDLGYIQVIEVQ